MAISVTILLAYLVVHASSHGVVTKITGANGVEMPGLSGWFINNIPMMSSAGT